MDKPPPLPPGKHPAKPVPASQPPARTALHPLTHMQRCEMFGLFSFEYTPTPTAPEKITISRLWLLANIVVVPLPHLMHSNGGIPVKARVHRLVAPRLLALFDAWRRAKLTLHIRTWNGSQVARYKRGKVGGGPRDLSNHAWGSAFDINAQWNRLGQTPAAEGMPGSVIPLVEIANALGWAWGGDFTNPDGMHFECVRLR